MTLACRCHCVNPKPEDVPAQQQSGNHRQGDDHCHRADKGPPTTSFELNGWGDDLVHDYLKAIEISGRIAVLYSNKDYGCEWDYDYRNKRFLAEDNTKFGVNIILYALNS